ncbi:MAG: GNAT family N-acetyltransferase [Saprospiraceae bacterium]|nr:GNAT family N-acetyltransferase [Saprospiraceae bacterium]
MLYRKASLEDIDQLAKMRWEFKTESETDTPVWKKDDFINSCKSFYANMLESNDKWLCWVVENESEIIAHVFIYIIDNIPTPEKTINKWGYLTNTFTKKSYRGKGLGSQLMQYAIAEAKSMNIETMIVWPSEKSIEFYKRAGFNNTSDIMERSFH